MRKILSVLLVLCMLMTLAPAAAITSFAEEVLEIPTIEEVSEDELVEIFGEGEIELYGTVTQADVPDTAGYTLISGLSGASVSATGTGLEGNTASLINGKYTTGTWGGANNNANAVWYKDGSDVIEGFMGWTISGQPYHAGSSIVVDLGSEQTFSGLRIYDSVRARSMQESTGGARKAKNVDISISADGKEWTAFDRIERTDFSDGVYDYLLKKTDAVNAKARYIKVKVDIDNTAWGQFEFEEIVLINKNDALTTTVEPELYRDYYDQDSYFTATSPAPLFNSDMKLSKLFDGSWHAPDHTGDDHNYWHTATGLTAEDRVIEITFAEAQKIGGFRIYPRVDNTGGNPRYITVFASTDGTSFNKIVDHAFVMNSGVKTPVEVLVQTGVAYKALKFQVDENASGNANNHTCFCELQVLKPKKGYAYEEDVIQFTTTPAVTAVGSTKVTDSHGNDSTTRDPNKADANEGLFDKVVYQFINGEDGYDNPWTGNPSGDPHFEMNFRALATDGNTAWAVIDLGKEYTFSGARVFGRWNQGGQGITEGILYVSDNGTDWVDLDKHTDAGSTVGKTYDASIVKNDKGEPTTSATNGKYNSTGDIYTEIAAKYKGTAYNVTARYIKIEAVKTSGNHWSMQELLLVKEDDANETKTVTELRALDTPAELDDYYTNPEDWTWTAGSTWTTGTTVTNLYDGVYYGDQDKCWHSYADPGNTNPDYVYTENDKTVTIMFDQPTEVGGVRVFPRTVNGGSSPNVIKMQGTYDGTNWVDVLGETKLGFTLGKEEYKEAYLANGRNNTFKGIKFISAKNINEGSTKYTCFTELQVLKPVTPKVALDTDEVNMEYPIGTTKAYGVKADSTVTDLTSTYSNLGKGTLIDGVILDAAYYQEIGGTDLAGRAFQVCFDHCIGGYKGGMETGYNYKKTYVDYDLGYDADFSGVRVYGRQNSPAYFTKGNVYVSEDGINWVQADTFSVDSARSTTLPVKFGGTAYNVKARHVRIECTATNSGHWGLEEIRLLNPAAGVETKTPKDIKTILATQADAVETLINAIGTPITMESKEKIDAARKAYDSLNPTAQAAVENYEDLTEAEAAIAQLEADAVEEVINALGDDPELQAVSEARMAYDALSETAKALVDEAVREKLEAAEGKMAGLVFELPVSQNTGLKKATFTMPVRDDMTIKSVKYEDIFGNEIDGTDATTVSVNGTTMTVTMAGDYKANEGLTQYTDGTGTYYFATDNAAYGWKAGDLIEPSFFKGLFIRRVAADKLGDHYITITFGDDTTAIVNLKTTPTWNTLTGAAAIADSEYTDEIVPKTTWKTTTTIRNTNLASAFDGKAEYLIHKGGVGGTSRFETDFVAGQYSPNADLSGKKEQVLLYMPVRFDFIIDTGEITKISGFRIYPRINKDNYNVDKTKGGSAGVPTSIVYWGSNDGIEWTNLGEYSYTTNTTEKTASFDNNVSYRYYKGSVLKANGKEFTTANISEFALLAPYTRVIGGDINVDLSEDIEDVTRTFNSDNTYAVTGVKVGSDTITADTDYVLNGTTGITFKASYLESLEVGEYEAEISFESGETAKVKLIVKDLSVVEYWLTSGVDYNGSGTLTLTNTTGKTAKSVSVGTTAVEFSQNPTEITVLRYHFKPVADVFAKLSADQDVAYNQPVTVTFEDDTTKEYTVKIYAQWYQVSSDVTTTFLVDEVVTGATWKVRNNAAQENLHPVNAFVKAAKNVQHGQNYHGAYTSVNGSATPDIKNHYIDVDMGTDVKEVGGIRYQSRFNSADWPAVTISGSDDYEIWTTLYTGKAAGAAGAYVMKFDQNSNFRYIRINITGANYPTADTIHFIKPALAITGETTFKKDINATDEEIEIAVEDIGAATIAKIVLGATTLPAAEYSYDAENDIVLIKAAALNRVTAESDVTLAIETSTGKVGSVTVKYMDFSKKMFPQEVTPYRFEHEARIVSGIANGNIATITNRKVTTKSDGSALANSDYANTALTHDATFMIYSPSGTKTAWNIDPGYFEVDYKIPHKFSAVRLYHRIWVDGGVRQYFTTIKEGYIEVSNDGINWIKSDLQTFGTGNLDSHEYNRNAYDDIKFIVDGIPMNVEARYVRVYPTKNGAWEPIGIEEICLYEPLSANAELTAAAITPAEPVFSLAAMEDLVLDVEWNDYIALGSINLMVDGELVPVEKGYYFGDEDSITISKYFFIDGGYDAGDEIDLAVIGAVGSPIELTVKVAEAEKYEVNYSAGENGTLKAVVRYTDMATGNEEEEVVASGSMVGRHENLVFVAEGAAGYEPAGWTLEGKGEDDVKYVRVTDKTGWSFAAVNEANPVGNAFDGKIDGYYWHSHFTAVNNVTTPSHKLTTDGPYWITALFDEPMMISEMTHTARLNADGTPYSTTQKVKDYKIWGTTDGGETYDVLLADGTTTKNEKTDIIALADVGYIDGIKFEIYSTFAATGDAHCSIAEITFTEKVVTEHHLAGGVTYTGSASQEFEIDNLFADATVTVEFAEIEAGTAKITTDLKRMDAEIEETKVSFGENAEITLVPDEGEELPEEITVTMDGVELKKGQDYTYYAETGEVVVKNVKGDIKVLAVAKDVAVYTVTFEDAHGATGTLPEAGLYTEGDTFKLPKNTLKLTGSTFAGWECSVDEEIYDAGDSYTMGAEDVTFSATWEAKESGGDDEGTKRPSIGGGGTGSSSSGTGAIGGGIGTGATTKVTVTVNGTATQAAIGTVLAAPVAPEGQEFIGWYLDAALTVPYANTGVIESITVYPGFRRIRSASELKDMQGHWAEKTVGEMYVAYFVNGTTDGNFEPDKNITRAEFCQILYLMSGQTTDGYHTFEDVNVGDWFTGAVAWAVKSGITQGTSETTFAPYDYITREQMATMIYRYATLMGHDWTITKEAGFADQTNVATYANYQVNWAADKGIINGYPDGTFAPKSNATKAEAVTMLQRLLNLGK